MSNNWNTDFGALIHSHRLKKKLPLRKVAAKLDIDTSTLSKIEKGERKVTSRMIPHIAELFDLDYKEMQLKYLTQKLHEEFGKEPFFYEALYALKKNGKQNTK
jgi:transcriptional regulator with XRE-family HTH domain